MVVVVVDNVVVVVVVVDVEVVDVVVVVLDVAVVVVVLVVEVVVVVVDWAFAGLLAKTVRSSKSANAATSDAFLLRKAVMAEGAPLHGGRRPYAPGQLSCTP